MKPPEGMSYEAWIESKAGACPPDPGQLELAIDRPARELAHTTDPETSHAAAAARSERKSTHRRVALLLHAAHGPTGLIDDEVSHLSCGVLDLIEARRRCSDLRRLGLIEWLTYEHVPVHRQSDAGQKARVSVITQRGKDAL